MCSFSVTSAPIGSPITSGNNVAGIAKPWEMMPNLPSLSVLILNFLFARNANRSSDSGHLLSISIYTATSPGLNSSFLAMHTQPNTPISSMLSAPSIGLTHSIFSMWASALSFFQAPYFVGNARFNPGTLLVLSLDFYWNPMNFVIWYLEMPRRNLTGQNPRSNTVFAYGV